MEGTVPGLDGNDGGIPPQMVRFSQFCTKWAMSTLKGKFPAGTPVVVRGRLALAQSGTHTPNCMLWTMLSRVAPSHF